MASTFNILPLIGIDFSLRTAEPDFGLGQPAIGNKSDTWVYVQAPAIVPVGACAVAPATWFVSTGAGNYTADTAFAAGEYGWVRLTDSPLLNPDA